MEFYMKTRKIEITFEDTTEDNALTELLKNSVKAFFDNKGNGTNVKIRIVDDVQIDYVQAVIDKTEIPQIMFGKRTEYCLISGCGHPMMKDGCTNPDCVKSRAKYEVQEGFRMMTLKGRSCLEVGFFTKILEALSSKPIKQVHA